MNWDKFKNAFDESWHEKIKPFIESEECDNIYKFLKHESARGKKIAPLSSNVYRCFKETRLDEISVILLGLSPYHTMRNNIPIADGLLMGCSVTGIVQPSLDQFYTALEKEYYGGLNLHIIKNPDVSYLAEQGVLMLNAALTTEINKAGSHLEIWEPFIKYLFEEVVNNHKIPAVFLGREAAKYKKYRPPMSWNFTLSHPASASYNHTEWDSQGVFKKVNEVIEKDIDKIQWLQIDKPF